MDQNSVVFDPFNENEDEHDQSQPINTSLSNIFSESFDTSFETSSFHFQASSNNESRSRYLRNEEWDTSFSFDENSQAFVNVEKQSIQVALDEELVCMHNSITRSSSCTLKGTLMLHEMTGLQGNKFFFIVKNPRQQIEKISPCSPNHSLDLRIHRLSNDMKSRYYFDERDTVFQVQVPSSIANIKFPMKLFSYCCPRFINQMANRWFKIKCAYLIIYVVWLYK